MRRILMALPALALLAALPACETVKGAGKDLSTAGQAITKEAEDVQEKYFVNEPEFGVGIRGKFSPEKLKN